MSNEGTPLFEQHPTNSELDLVNTSKGPMSRKDYREWRSANPKAPRTGLGVMNELARQRATGKITEQQYMAMASNHLSSAEEQRPIPTHAQSIADTADREEASDFIDAHEHLGDIISNAEAHARAGGRNLTFHNRIDDAYMQVLRTIEKHGITGMEDQLEQMQLDIENAKLNISQANAMNKFAR